MATQLESPTETTSINYSQLNNLGLIDEELKHLSYPGQCNLLYNNPVLVVMHFQYKAESFFKEIILEANKMISKKSFHSTLFWSSFVKKELQSPKMFYLPTKLVYGRKQINKIKMKTDMTIWPPKHLRNRKDQVVWNHTIRFYFWINWWIKMHHFWYSLNGINMNLGQAGAQHKTHRAWKQSPKSKIKPPTAWNQVNICKESSLVKYVPAWWLPSIYLLQRWKNRSTSSCVLKSFLINIGATV